MQKTGVPISTSYDILLHKEVPFEGRDVIAAYLGGKILPLPKKLAFAAGSKHAHSKSKMADGRHFENSLNRHNSAMVPSIFTEFAKMTHFGRLHRL